MKMAMMGEDNVQMELHFIDFSHIYEAPYYHITYMDAMVG